MARPEKIQKVEQLAEVFANARSVVLNDFTGLNVEKLSTLRRRCREAGVEYLVVKNTLAKRGLQGTAAEQLADFFEGPTALAVARDSEHMAAKVVVDFAKDNEDIPAMKAAVVEGKVIDATAVLALATLPSREQLVSQVMAGLMAPGNGLVSVLQGTLRNLLYAVNAIIEKKKTEGGEAPQQAE